MKYIKLTLLSTKRVVFIKIKCIKDFYDTTGGSSEKNTVHGSIYTKRTNFYVVETADEIMALIDKNNKKNKTYENKTI